MDTSQANVPMVATVMTLTPTDIGLDIVAVVIGLIAVISVVRLNQKLGGKIKSALWFFLFGVFTNMFAMLWTVFFGHTYSIGAVTFDVHDAFMAIGMVFFSLSAYRFSLMVPRE
jgi:hypothetical protein